MKGIRRKVMWTLIFAITTLICAGKWLSYKLGILTILFYLAESGIALPDGKTVEEYRKKTIKKCYELRKIKTDCRIIRKC